MDVNFKVLKEIYHGSEVVIRIVFLIAFGFVSRVSWDYLINGVIPKKRRMLAMFVLAVFSSMILLLSMRAAGMSRENMEIGVPFAAFLGHNTLTFFMENKDEILKRILAMFNLKKK